MDENTLRDRLQGTEEEAVLLAVAEDGGHSFPEVVDAVTGGRADTVRVVSNLQELGLVDREQSLAYDIRLTGLGSRLATQITESRTSGRDRSDAVRGGLLRWLARPDMFATHTRDFVGEPSASAWAVPFSDGEVQAASDLLTERGLIKSHGAWGAATGFRPEITPEGRAAVESGEPISVYVRGGRPSADVTNTANFHGGNVAGVQLGGQGNTMHVVQNVTHEERTQVLAGVAEVRQTLADAGVVSAELDSALAAVHEEAAKPDASRPNLRERITEAVAVAAATQGASLALQGIAGLLNVIPM